MYLVLFGCFIWYNRLMHWCSQAIGGTNPCVHVTVDPNPFAGRFDQPCIQKNILMRSVKKWGLSCLETFAADWTCFNIICDMQTIEESYTWCKDYSIHGLISCLIGDRQNKAKNRKNYSSLPLKMRHRVQPNHIKYPKYILCKSFIINFWIFNRYTKVQNLLYTISWLPRSYLYWYMFLAFFRRSP